MKVTQSLITASGIIKNGGVIAYPTEGIWGIGGLNTSEIQQKIYLAKKRDDSKKFILLFKSSDQLFEHFPEAEKYKETINSFKNSFTTILLPLEKGKTAIRIPNYKRLVEFLGLIDKPLISTSANISGNEVCKTIEEIENIFKDKIEGILDMPLGGEKNPSTIYDLELDEYIR